jgi:hypothetical protein
MAGGAGVDAAVAGSGATMGGGDAADAAVVGCTCGPAAATSGKMDHARSAALRNLASIVIIYRFRWNGGLYLSISHI